MAEVIATLSLQASHGMSRLGPSLAAVIGYAVAFYLLSLTLQKLPVGVVYAIWSGAGIVLVGIVGWIALGQRLDTPALAGIGLILAGVLLIQLFSRTAQH